MSLLEVTDLHSGYGANEVIHDIDFHTDSGEVVTILGPNGSGKTTFVRTLLGYLRARRGSIYFAGNDVTSLSPTERTRLGIGYVPQLANIFRPLTVRENLEMGGYGLNRSTLSASLERIYGLFPVLHERQAQRAGTLSGGERQILAVARAMMVAPRLLFLDEPSAGLSPLRADEIFACLRHISSLGIALVLIEQDAKRSLAVSTRAYVLVTGEVAFCGTPAEVMLDDRIRAAYLGASAAATDNQRRRASP
jgi:ABC-type branched-subunit amino acid transport system ATPase component